MWLVVLGSCVTLIEGVSGSYIGSTKYCFNARLEPYCIIPLSLKNGRRMILFSDYLPAFSRSILKDEQLYFLTTIFLNLAMATLFNNTGVPVIYRFFVGVPNIVLMNSMVWHAFRKIRLGVYRETTTLP
ncbi:hypothetical protein CPB84DRAFT_1179561 [Gymnopilus junonius]|uniref:Uncharacterized protein n=1 Tax=Gymnopilus junonius TaxID=109634 RepID=A0A9P5NP08_GYMJU|nr:hypothetical protein CPB84DRAFT_1179561 [Gymnopilus junonius]